MIGGVTNAGALPVLERMAQFAGQRQRLLANNIANLSTPEYRPVDVSVAKFQENLGTAIDRRRAANGATGGDLPLASTQEVEVHQTGVTLKPGEVGDNILFHDGNDRDLDRTMQGMVENFMAFRAAAQFMRKEFETLHTAISGRI